MTKTKDFYPRESWLREIMGRDDIRVKGTALAVLSRADGSVERYHGLNVVTDDGDIYYAQMAAGEAPDNEFTTSPAGLRLGDDNTAVDKTDTDVTSFLAGTGHTVDATYPKTDDDDPNNAADADENVLSWRYSYGTTEGNAVDIIEGAIVDDIVTPTVALNHFLFDGVFTKTAADTLAVTINHQFLGV